MSSRLGSARKTSRPGKRAQLFHRPWECEVCQEERVEQVGVEVISWASEACERNSGDLANFLTGAFAHPGDYVPQPVSQQGMGG
eukprot:8555947-Pyramimonas_sp.AAC.1